MESLEYRHSFSNPTTVATAGTGTTTASNVTVVDNIYSKGHKKTSKNSISPTIPGGGSCIYTHTASVFCLHRSFTLRNILEKEDEIWFRDFGFGRIHRMLGACCSAFRYLKLANNMKKIWMEVHDDDNPNLNEKIEKDSVDDDTIRKRQAKFQEEFGFVVKDDETECCCVIDSGFSLTHRSCCCKFSHVLFSLMIFFCYVYISSIYHLLIYPYIVFGAGIGFFIIHAHWHMSHT